MYSIKSKTLINCNLEPKTYYGHQIKNMNKTYPWNGSIMLPFDFKDDKMYTLKSTGTYNVRNGRQYIAVKVPES